MRNLIPYKIFESKNVELDEIINDIFLEISDDFLIEISSGDLSVSSGKFSEIWKISKNESYIVRIFSKIPMHYNWKDVKSPIEHLINFLIDNLVKSMVYI